MTRLVIPLDFMSWQPVDKAPPNVTVLVWWRKDALGWPIETFKGRPVKSAIRIICQNIRKVIFKPNSADQTPKP